MQLNAFHLFEKRKDKEGKKILMYLKKKGNKGHGGVGVQRFSTP
jgi:hypothetical protein